VNAVRGIARFVVDFVIGDDWRVAAGVVVALAATALLADTDLGGWWLMPLAVVALLAASLRRATRS
jgi:hypothetical protein